MRRAIEIAFRFLVGIVVATSAYIPAGLLLAWAAVYVLDCWGELLSPSGALEYRYQAQGGTATLRVGKYWVLPEEKRVLAERISLSDPRGEQVLSVRYVEADMSLSAIKAVVHGVQATVYRRPGGKISVSELLPVSKEKPEARSYAVQVVDAQVTYIDQAGRVGLRRTAKLNAVRVEGRGQDFVARGAMTAEGLGWVPLQLRSLPSGFDAEARLTRANLAPWIDVAKELYREQDLGEYGPIDATSTSLTGPIRVFFPKRGNPKWNANLEGELVGVSAGRIVANAGVRLRAEARGESARVVARLTESNRSAAIDGSITWGDAFSAGGKLELRLPNSSLAWEPLKQILPTELDFTQLEGSGWLNYGEKKGVAIDGRITAQSASWEGERVQTVSTRLWVTNNQIALSDLKGRWMQVPATGELAIDFRTSQMTGHASVPSTDLRRFADRFGVPQVRGIGSASATIGGTTKRPVFRLASRGNVGWESEAGRVKYLGAYDVYADIRNSQLVLRRAGIIGINGALTAQGGVNLARRSVSIDVHGGGFALSTFDPDIKGTGFFDARVRGPLSDVATVGSVQLYALRFGEHTIPVVTGDLTWSNDRLVANHIVGSIGNSHATGQAVYDLRSGALKGEFDAANIQLADWTEGHVVGYANADGIVLGGNIDAPTIQAKLRSAKLAAAGFGIEGVGADLFADANGLRVSNLHGKVDQGVIDGEVTYRFDTDTWSARAKGEQLPLGSLPDVHADISLQGLFGGTVNLTGTGSKVTGGVGELSIQDGTLNGTLIGSGAIDAKVENGIWFGSGTIGQITRYLSVESASYDPATKRVGGLFESNSFLVEDLISVLSPSLKDTPARTRELLEDASGEISAKVQVSGTTDDPELDLPIFTASKLQFAGRSAGSVSVTGAKRGNRWRFEDFLWKDEQATLSASGSFVDGGAIDVSGRLQGLDLGWLNAIDPAMPSLFGAADAELRLSGEARSPNADGWLKTRDLGFVPSESGAKPIKVLFNLDKIQVRNGIVSSQGTAEYEQFHAFLEGSGPLRSLYGEAKDAPSDPFRVKATFRTEELNALNVPGIDKDRTNAEISGWLELLRRPDGQELGGNLSLQGDQVGFRVMDTVLRNPSITANVRSNRVELQGTATSSDGGAISIEEGNVQLPQNLSLEEGLEELLAAMTVSAKLSAKDFAFVQNPTNRASRSDGRVSADVSVTGNLLEPRLSGNLTVNSASVALPDTFAARPSSQPPLINPTFADIRLGIEQPITIKSGDTTVKLGGAGSLGGTLHQPALHVGMVLDSGTVNLPTSRVTLEPGGTLDLSYTTDQRGIGVSRLMSQMRGTTYVTARRVGDIVERYEITLDITGDLLAENGMRLRASSEPGDLSESEILSLLGQRALIEALDASSLLRGQGLQDPLFTVFIPRLTDPVTADIARAFKLDYLHLEYNAIEQATLSFGKTLATGLTLSFRRQISPGAFERPRFDLRLTYRPPVRNRFLSRIRFGIGIDQDRPWKLTLDYGLRF